MGKVKQFSVDLTHSIIYSSCVTFLTRSNHKQVETNPKTNKLKQGKSFSVLAADTPWDSGTTWSTMDFYTMTLHIPLSFGWIYVVTQILQQPVLDPNTKAISLLIAQTLELILTLILLKYTAKPQHNFLNFFKAIGFGFLFMLVLGTSFLANGLLEPKLDKSHIFITNMFDDFDRFMSVPNTWAPLEVKLYTLGVILYSILNCHFTTHLSPSLNYESIVVMFVAIFAFEFLFRKICNNGLLMRRPKTSL
ncbi:hypothetical protein UlMin_044734 [Ulmus minor]